MSYALLEWAIQAVVLIVSYGTVFVSIAVLVAIGKSRVPVNFGFYSVVIDGTFRPLV